MASQPVAGGSGASQVALQPSAEAQRALGRAAYLAFYSGANYDIPEKDYFLVPGVALSVFRSLNHELGRRLDIRLSSLTADGGFRIRRAIGEKLINQSDFQMLGVPNYFQPNFGTRAGLTPAPSTFGPLPRKTMLIPERYAFLDELGSELDCDGVARFYPASGGALYIAGVGDVTVGKGQLRGSVGTLTVNGYASSPPFFSNHFTFRLVQPIEKLVAGGALPPLAAEFPDPEPASVLLPLLAELDPASPVVVGPSTDGAKKQVQLVARLRWADAVCDVSPGSIQSRMAAGEVVGEHRLTLVFDPDDTNQVTPLYSAQSAFTFRAGKTPIGTLQAQLTEGRAIRTSSPELSQPYFRLGAYGQLGAGTGQFASLTGIISVNGSLSLQPAGLSAMVLLRIADPLLRFRPLWP